ncbi:MAG: hypothetical protein F6K54_34785 [Okeania sp. SIO3B5]|uniref:hypothetical protein n=1 Tax=Okeania sp. SIO3B5 TaxID=2607811 RepID=UPI0013FF1CA0|nr:hypothetical protein [Okeania sp. SIO3B5]NEO57779.1 hypothetical protein [Okeania sp. SIO3B5]
MPDETSQKSSPLKAKTATYTYSRTRLYHRQFWLKITQIKTLVQLKTISKTF